MFKGMFGYHLRTAVRSLKRNPILTTLLIVAVALGICISTSFTTLRHAVAKDPLPGKSKTLFYVRLDNWDPQRPYRNEDPKSIPTQVTYRDARALLDSKIPTRQTASFMSNMFIFPDSKTVRPYQENVRLVFGDFFAMFDVPFQYGGAWSKSSDEKLEPVAVIDSDTNEKLFGNRNSVGQSLRIRDRVFRIVGVLAPWRPTVRMYDITQGAVRAPEGIYIPFNFVQPMQIRSSGNFDNWKSAGPTFESLLQSESVWIQYWAELPTAEKVAAYKQFVDSYVMDQKKLGRFQRPLHTEVTPMMQWFKEAGVVMPQINAMSVVSLLFLLVCSLNLVGVILGKFLTRVPEVSVRRALGASRRDVFLQHIIEVELIGLIGGPIGIGLSVIFLSFASKLLRGNAPVHLDAEMILAAIALSLVAGLVAGLYPAWRICSIPPAMQLKIQ